MLLESREYGNCISDLNLPCRVWAFFVFLFFILLEPVAMRY